MIKDNAFILVDSFKDYSGFINTIGNYLENTIVYTDAESFIEALEDYFSSGKISSEILLLIIDFDYMELLSKHLEKLQSSVSHILVAFSFKNEPSAINYRNIFDCINIQSKDFNAEFFFNRLREEIGTKNKLILLQSEVRQFYEIGASLSSEKDTVKLFEMILKSSMNLTSSDAGTIYIVVDKVNGGWSSVNNSKYTDKLLKFVIAKNLSMDVKLETTCCPIRKESISGYAVLTGQPVRIDDVYNISPKLDYHHDQSYDLFTGYKTKSVLTIPMKDHQGNIMGVIQLINKKNSPSFKLDCYNDDCLNSILPFDYADELTISSLAGQAAVALENNLLYRDMQNLLDSYKQQNIQLENLSKKILKAHEEERKRIAREIHDGPAQSVVNLSLKLEICKRHLQNSDHAKAFEGLEDLNANIKGTVKEIRTIIYDLKPSYLEEGLIKALENHLDNFAGSTGIQVRFSTSGDDSVLEYYMISTLYRIVQEALTNIYKHAEARTVEVDFTLHDNRVSLLIMDDGKGFDPTVLSQGKKRSIKGGFGLEGMKERVELIKGEMIIRSLPSKGSAIIINIPL